MGNATSQFLNNDKGDGKKRLSEVSGGVCTRMWFRKEVLPLPRKPVMIVTGT